MPEGDTIHKLADYLAPMLTGRKILAGLARTTDAVDLKGSRISKVFAQGKHLFIALDNNRLLRSHLGMWGSWHKYAKGELWQKPQHQASIILDTGDRIFVCFNAAQVEILRRTGVRQRTLQVTLGPDLLVDQVEYKKILIRARDLFSADAPLLDVLLDQRVACGIGNVYKSEVLFLAGCNPKVHLGQINDEQLERLYRLASLLLKQNKHGGPRVTRRVNDDAGKLWVYGRKGKPCLRCEDFIRSARIGKGMRSTYWCQTCQTAAYC